MTLFAKIVIFVILLLICVVFTLSERALEGLSDSEIKERAEAGDKKAVKIAKMLSSRTRFSWTHKLGTAIFGSAATICFCSVLKPFFLKGIAGLSCYMPGQNLDQDMLLLNILYYVCTVFSFLLAIFLISVFAVGLPGKKAAERPENTSYSVCGVMSFFFTLLFPLYFIVRKTTSLLSRLFGLNANTDEERVTEEEIRMMVDVGEEKGVIEESQRDMINNIFEFDDIDVGDVMSHRTEITAVPLSCSIADVTELAIREGFSRIPVYDDDLDNIVGIIYVKDLLNFVGKDIPEKAQAKNVMRKAYHVPESKRCGELFTEMTEKHIQMAIVIDEYGGTAGLVTLEDLIESIVGNIQDEYDDEEEEIKRFDDGTYLIDGTCDIAEVQDLLSTQLPQGDYDTISGLMLTELGRLPEESEKPSIECAGYRFTAVNTDDRHIKKIKAEKIIDAKCADEN